MAEELACPSNSREFALVRGGTRGEPYLSSGGPDPLQELQPVTSRDRARVEECSRGTVGRTHLGALI